MVANLTLLTVSTLDFAVIFEFFTPFFLKRLSMPTPLTRAFSKRWPAAILSACSLLASAAQTTCPSETNRFTANGAEVTDTKTGLIWARCSAGQTWRVNACTGTAGSYTRKAALTLAASQAGWRLPNVSELASMADKGCINPAFDTGVFPATLNTHYWSSSPFVVNPGYAWYVSFNNGVSRRYGYRSNNYSVRLVRAS